MQSDTQPVPTAISLYAAARGYLQAAKMIALSEHRKGPNIEGVFLPLNMLLGFSLELYLKSWLLQAGRTAAELRKNFSHDLNKLFAAARETGLPAVDRLDETVAHFHGPHSQFEYRYMALETIYRNTSIDQACAVLYSLDTVVDAATGASASVGKLPGH